MLARSQRRRGLNISGTYVIVGWTRSRWPWSSVGIEYARVRTDCWPVSECSKTWKSASNISFACITLTENANQSPAREMV